MKSKRFALPFALIFLLSVFATPSLAFAVPDKTVPSATTSSTTKANSVWLAMKEAAKPYQADMRANDQEFKALREQLGIEVEAARQRIEDKLSASITADELLSIEQGLATILELTQAVKADIGNLGEEMTLLRGRKTDLDLPGMEQCFKDAILIQEGRIDLVSAAITVVKAIAS